jgi:hypothetical protein
MIPAARILDHVVEILKAAPSPLVAREICNELSRKGVNIERPKLTQILWNQNDRTELVVDKNTFKWRYDPVAARRAEEAERRKAETKRELAKHAAFLEFWEQIGFEFIGEGERIRRSHSFFFEKMMTIIGSSVQRAICSVRGPIFAQSRKVCFRANLRWTRSKKRQKKF